MVPVLAKEQVTILRHNRLHIIITKVITRPHTEGAALTRVIRETLASQPRAITSITIQITIIMAAKEIVVRITRCNI